jgi:hypothetical protein
LSVTRPDLRAFEQLVAESAVFVTSSPTSWGSAASPSRRAYCYVRRAPALLGFAPLQSPRSIAPVGGFPTASPGIRPGCAHCRRHCCRSRTRRSGPSRPSIDLVPGVHSRADIAAVAFVSRCHPRNRVPTSPFRTVSPVFSATLRRCRRSIPPEAGVGLTGLLHPVADPGVRCVSRGRSGGSGTPHWPCRHGRCAAGHADAVSSQRVSYPLEDSPHL